MQLTALALSPSGRVLAGGTEAGILDLRDAVTGAILKKHETAAPITSLAFSPDGNTLATFSRPMRSDGVVSATITLWNIATWEQLSRWQIQTTSFPSMVFSPDGKKLAVGGRMWDLERMTEIDVAPDPSAAYGRRVPWWVYAAAFVAWVFAWRRWGRSLRTGATAPSGGAA